MRLQEQITVSIVPHGNTHNWFTLTINGKEAILSRHDTRLLSAVSLFSKEFGVVLDMRTVSEMVEDDAKVQP